MSDQQGKIMISLEDLLAQADLLKKQIEDLQKAQSEIADSLSAIKSAKDTIDELKTPKNDLFLSGDKKGFLMLRIPEAKADKVIVYLGLTYYAEVTPDTAVKILSDRENELNLTLQEVNKKLSESINAYSQISDILNRIQEQQQKGE
ncbi:prefoldin subunit alpha [Acidianus brierleyi]|uniref:Prefoldin subunit alpha n=1 Tax=Acidianus brierleyi TaxID=41673 RepID=A0A2U9IFW2_9CREN|nr:prefoldin subunit alpha [Acidianus brierleyi]AWR94909.1 prefoldin subunit alpha [Acidianus brierleyi]